MELNNLVFPAPSSTYTTSSIQDLLWIPRSKFFSIKALLNQSPCSTNTLLDYKSSDMSSKQPLSHSVYLLSLFVTLFPFYILLSHLLINLKVKSKFLVTSRNAKKNTRILYSTFTGILKISDQACPS